MIVWVGRWVVGVYDWHSTHCSLKFMYVRSHVRTYIYVCMQSICMYVYMYIYIHRFIFTCRCHESRWCQWLAWHRPLSVTSVLQCVAVCCSVLDAWMCNRDRVCIRIHTYICIYTRIYIRTYRHTYALCHGCMNVQSYVCLYVCMYIRMYIHIFVFTIGVMWVVGVGDWHCTSRAL